jgi:hypothetical protein
VKAGNDKDAGDICAVVEHIGESLEKLPSEALTHERASAREQPDSTHRGLYGIDELLTEAHALMFVPVSSECDIGDRGGVESDVCH